MQDSTTSNMCHDVATIMSFVSQRITLLPGDIILTGTPCGVGFTRDPPIFLKHGDEVVCMWPLASSSRCTTARLHVGSGRWLHVWGPGSRSGPLRTHCSLRTLAGRKCAAANVRRDLDTLCVSTAPSRPPCKQTLERPAYASRLGTAGAPPQSGEALPPPRSLPWHLEPGLAILSVQHAQPGVAWVGASLRGSGWVP
eukprot:scaffold1637_cov410-Prasinococcus_capsulatus_cf.AAC.1